jgi:hypothetical protein
MKKLTLPLAALTLLFTFLAAHASSPATATAAFSKLQSLAGDWEGTDHHGKPVKTNFKPVAANTAVLETLSMTGMEEMLTLYSVDHDGIVLVHYCPTNNQPRMRAIPQDGAVNELDFRFQGVTNLPDPTAGHEQELTIQFEDKDHITEIWTWRENGKDTKMTCHFSRSNK